MHLFYKNAILTILLVGFTSLNAQQSPKIGVALGGGGALGYAQLGVLRVLEENNIPVHIVSGTSAGAIIGALYSLGYSPSDIEQILGGVDYMAIIDDKKSRRVEDTRTKMHPWSSMIGRTFYQSEGKGRKTDFSIFTGQLIDSFFDYLFWDGGAYKNFSEFPRSFVATGADTVTNRKVIFTEGPLGKAVRASMALPFILTPEYYDGHAIVDGGIINNLPVEDAFNLGADVVIAIHVSNDRREDSKSALDLIFQQRLYNDARAKEMATVLINPDLSAYNTASFGHAKELVALGEAAAREALPLLLKYAINEDVSISKPTITPPTINNITVLGTTRPALIERVLDLETPTNVDRDKALQHAELVSRHMFVAQLHFFYQGDTLFIEIRENTGTKIGLNIAYNTDFSAKLSVGIEIKEMQPISFFFQGHFAFNQGLETYGSIYLFAERYPHLNYLFSWNISDNFGQGARYPDSSILPRKRLPNIYEVNTGLAVTVGNYFYFSTVYQYEYMNTHAIFDPSFYGNVDSEHSTSLQERIVIDYLDSNRYPTSGLKAFLSMEQGLPPFNNFNYWRVHSGIRGAVPLGKGFSLGLETEGGFLMGEEAPQSTYFTLGGLYTEQDRNYLQGFTINTAKGQSLWLVRSNIMYSVLSRFHVITQWNAAFVDENVRLTFNKENFYQAAGLRLAADFTPFLVESGFFWNITQNSFAFSLILGSNY